MTSVPTTSGPTPQRTPSADATTAETATQLVDSSGATASAARGRNRSSSPPRRPGRKTSAIVTRKTGAVSLHDVVPGMSTAPAPLVVRPSSSMARVTVPNTAASVAIRPGPRP